MNEQRWPTVALAAAGLLFVLLATVNSAGYRYGVSDQAFHVPAVVRALDPAAFPRDAALLDSQARFMLFDDGVALVVRTTGWSLEAVFFIGYLVTAGLLWTGILLIGRQLLRSPAATLLLGAAVTLRHRIPRTSANSIEPYFYPRTLAFALGVLAIAALLRRRRGPALLLVSASALVHVTTGAWFAVLIGVACLWLSGRVRRLQIGAVAAACAALVAAWLTASGRLPLLIRPIDATWLDVIGTKDSLFPTDWPLWAWLANLGLPVALLVIHHWRGRLGTRSDEDRALVTGAMALTALFLVTIPLVAARWALPTQLQISRVFWLIDFVTLMYGVALVAELSRQPHARVSLRVAAAAMVALSMARGAFVMLSEYAERRMFQVTLPASDWTAAMAWLATQPVDTHVLANPGHALLYGSSVRVAAHRDVVLEDSKDTAVALYSRELALRIGERRRTLADFDQLSSNRAAAVSRRYEVDYLVTAGAPLSFPLAYSNRTFRIYDMRGVTGTGGNTLTGSSGILLSSRAGGIVAWQAGNPNQEPGTQRAHQIPIPVFPDPRSPIPDP